MSRKINSQPTNNMQTSLRFKTNEPSFDYQWALVCRRKAMKEKGKRCEKDPKDPNDFKASNDFKALFKILSSFVF